MMDQFEPLGLEGEVGKGGGSGDWSGEEMIAGLLTTHRDWRVDLEDGVNSFVFMIGMGGRTGVSPVSARSPEGRKLERVFERLSQTVEAHFAELLSVSEPEAGDVDAISGKGAALRLESARRFAITVAGVRCRVQHILGRRFHIRVTSDLIEFDRLGLPMSVQRAVLGEALDEGGLVIVCGNYGSGKTSTRDAIIRQRVRTRGGYALVMGDPIEYKYSGFHGTNACPGYVEQVDLAGRDLAAEVKASMRNFPAGAVSIMAFPELLSSEGAGEILRAANHGSLVFCDMHASNITAALLNLVAKGELDGERNSRDLLANSLKMILHLTMSPAPNGPNSGQRSVAITARHQMIERRHQAAIADPSTPLSKAIGSIFTTPTADPPRGGR
jgi:Tfp pilus assembly pilus retraction ATPase PilT